MLYMCSKGNNIYYNIIYIIILRVRWLWSKWTEEFSYVGRSFGLVDQALVVLKADLRDVGLCSWEGEDPPSPNHAVLLLR